MSAVAVAQKEFMEHVRTKRLLIVAGMFLLFLAIGIWVGTLLSREVFRANALPGVHRSNFVLAFYFGLFPLVSGINFTSVLGILLTADAVVGEWKDRTLFLLLSKPVSRSAMLMGKLMGAIVAVFSAYATVFILGAIVVFALVGVPDAKNLGRIGTAFALIFLGMLPFVAMALFFSTVFRSPVASFIMSFAMWFVVFPVLGFTGYLIRIGTSGVRGLRPDGFTAAWQHIDPTFLMREGARPLLGGQGLSGIFGSASEAAVNVPGLLLAVALHLVVWLSLALWVVNRRDYA